MREPHLRTEIYPCGLEPPQGCELTQSNIIMETKFKDERTGCTIYAPLGGSLIHGTMRYCDLVPVFLRALRDTLEYKQFMLECKRVKKLRVVIEVKASEWDERWSSREMNYLVEDLIDTLDKYTPDGYYFGCHPGDGSDYGYWPIDLID